MTISAHKGPHAIRKIVPQAVLRSARRPNGILLGQVFDSDGEIRHDR